MCHHISLRPSGLLYHQDAICAAFCILQLNPILPLTNAFIGHFGTQALHQHIPFITHNFFESSAHFLVRMVLLWRALLLLKVSHMTLPPHILLDLEVLSVSSGFILIIPVFFQSFLKIPQPYKIWP